MYENKLYKKLVQKEKTVSCPVTATVVASSFAFVLRLSLLQEGVDSFVEVFC